METDEAREVCGAKTQGGTKCQKPPRPGRNRCHLHGGATLRGPASPSWKHGRYSKNLPASMVEDFRAAYQDPEYMSLRNQIAMNEALEAEAVRGLATLESEEGWRALQSLTTLLTDAAVDNDIEEVLKVAGRIDEVVDKGVKRLSQKRELKRIQEHGRKLKATQSQMLKDRETSIPVERAVALIAFIIHLLRDRVEERVLEALAEEISDRLSTSDALKPLILPPPGRHVGVA